jgi:hypothetical protein
VVLLSRAFARIQRSLPQGVIVTEIPKADRDINKVERFKVTVQGQAWPWIVSYSDDDFDAV